MYSVYIDPERIAREFIKSSWNNNISIYLCPTRFILDIYVCVCVWEVIIIYLC